MKKTVIFQLICILYAVVDIDCIYGGHNAILEEFPYHALCVRSNDPQNKFCSGVILSSRYILTSAWCTDYKIQNVFVGTRNTDGGGTKLKIEKTIQHPAYKVYKDYFGSNIALLRTAEKITFTPKIQAATIWSSDLREGTRANVTGWGMDRFLQYIERSTMNGNACKAKLDNPKVSDKHICTNNKIAEGICHPGDEGSPLVAHDGYVIGIASRVPKGDDCYKGIPDVFIKVAAFHEWIEDVMSIGYKSYSGNTFTTLVLLEIIVLCNIKLIF